MHSVAGSGLSATRTHNCHKLHPAGRCERLGGAAGLARRCGGISAYARRRGSVHARGHAFGCTWPRPALRTCSQPALVRANPRGFPGMDVALGQQKPNSLSRPDLARSMASRVNKPGLRRRILAAMHQNSGAVQGCFRGMHNAYSKNDPYN